MKFKNPFKRDPFNLKKGSFEDLILQDIFKTYKANTLETGGEFLDYSTEFIVKGIESVISDDATLFNIRGGEFPSSLFSRDEIIEALSNITPKDIKNDKFGVFGGAFFCIGDVNENDVFSPSRFLMKILEMNIPYKVRSVIDFNETRYNPNTKIVHHPISEHHFRLLQKGKGDYECISHVHHPVTGERLFMNVKYDDTKVFLNYSGKKLIDFFKHKTNQVLKYNDERYSDVKSMLENFHFTSKDKNIKNRFIVDVKEGNYEMATEKQINDFFKQASEFLNPNSLEKTGSD